MLGISCLDEQLLASQQGFCHMAMISVADIVSYNIECYGNIFNSEQVGI
jgi:hypothetical protein